jgi:hypothetical protein
MPRMAMIYDNSIVMFEIQIKRMAMTYDHLIVMFGFQINQEGHNFFTNMQLWDPKDKIAIQIALKNLHGWYPGYEERINKVIVEQVSGDDLKNGF